MPVVKDFAIPCQPSRGSFGLVEFHALRRNQNPPIRCHIPAVLYENRPSIPTWENRMRNVSPYRFDAPEPIPNFELGAGRLEISSSESESYISPEDWLIHFWTKIREGDR